MAETFGISEEERKKTESTKVKMTKREDNVESETDGEKTLNELAIRDEPNEKKEADLPRNRGQAIFGIRILRCG